MHDYIGSATEQELCQLLIQLDLLTRDQVNDAFLYQCRLPKSEVKPIEEILVEMELISPTMLDQVKQMYQQANQIYGRGTGPLELAVPQKAPARLKKGGDLRQTLRPLQRQRSQDLNVRKTAELRLSPELQAVIKGVAIQPPPALPELPQYGQPAELPAWAMAQKDQPVAFDKTLMMPAAESDEHDPCAGQRLEPLSEVMADKEPAIETVSPLPPFTPAPVPKTMPASEAVKQLSLPDLSAKLPKGLLPPQLGEILLNNHDLEEWQLMHALCIQKEGPAGTPRLGTLLIKLGYVNRQAVERALSVQLAEELNTERKVS